jgi:GNAT superfamily N-acetyltransferase
MIDPMFECRGGFELSTDPGRLDRERIFLFLNEQSYWAAGIPRDVVERALDHSLCVGIYREGHQVAFARAITDRATFAYLADVFVDTAHRGAGLGKWMVDALLRHRDLQGLRRWLLATRDAHGLYAQFGFVPLANPSRMLERHDADVYARLSVSSGSTARRPPTPPPRAADDDQS